MDPKRFHAKTAGRIVKTVEGFNAFVPAPLALTLVNTAADSPLTKPVAANPFTLWLTPLYVVLPLLAVTTALALPMVKVPLLRVRL